MSETRNKYHAVKADCAQGGTLHRHDSKRERDRCWTLHRMQERGMIQHLVVHPPAFDLSVAGIHIANYEPDFSYAQDERFVVEDVKGGVATKTRAYRIKAKLMQACHGITIREVP